MQTQTTRTEKLDLRLSGHAKQILKNAARASKRSVSEFVLESALSRAEETLADRQSFALNAKQWKLFMEALEAQPRELPRLKKLFQKQSVFDRK